MKPIFKCAKCGASYAGVSVLRGNTSLSGEERDKLRAAWHKTIDKFNTEGLRPEQLKDAEVAEIKTSAAYLNTTVWESWNVPDDLITVKDANGHRFECGIHHPVQEMEERFDKMTKQIDQLMLDRDKLKKDILAMLQLQRLTR